MAYSLTSDKNQLKRHESSGSYLMDAPQTAASWGFYTAHVVKHNLGYEPQVRVYFKNSESDGKLYPAGGRRSAGSYPGLPFNSIYCLWELSTTDLTIYLESATSKTGIREVHYIIYEDQPE